MPKRRAIRGRGQVLRSGRNWAIRFVENGVRRFEGGYESDTAAKAALAKVSVRLAAGLPAFEQKYEASTRRFGDMVDDWFTHRELHDELRSVPDDRIRWESHLRPVLEQRTIDTVDSDLLASLVVQLKAKGLSGGTIERTLHLLSAFYKWADLKGYSSKNPVAEYLRKLGTKARGKLRSAHRPEDTPFLHSTDDVVRIFQALPEPVNVAYALSALAGLRPGEVLALEWPNVDLNAGTVHIVRQVRHGRVGKPKSGKDRTVDLVPSLVAVLKTWREKNPGAQLVVPPYSHVNKHGEIKVRRNRFGAARFLNLRTIYAALDAALEACNLPRMTFYEAGRHTFASLWVLRGLDIYKLSKILGHSSVTTTERYAHLTKKTPAELLARADIPLAIKSAV